MQVLVDQAIEEQEDVNIYDIISNKKIVVHFQPIVSVARKMVCGLEGLIRGINTDTNEIISPITLFDIAKREGLTVDLDRVCREKVVEAFSYIYKYNKDKLLFINVDASIIDEVGGSNFLKKQVKKYEINPRNIVIEINETNVRDTEALKRFVDTYRDLGFLIALDDVGTGFSNMDRVLLVKPDIIKIDMSLIKNIQNDYYKQEVFKSLVSLSNKIGAIVIAEGVEIVEEAIQTLKYGGHMIQGYFFSKPQATYSEPNIIINNRIEMLTKSFKEYMNKMICEDKKKNKKFRIVVNNILSGLIMSCCHDFDNILIEYLNENKTIECAYILDKHGIQFSNTIRSFDSTEEQENLIYYSASSGTDHSMKKYYYSLVNGRLNKYITEPYISLATGRLCFTFSKFFKTCDNKQYVLCMDFDYNIK